MEQEADPKGLCVNSNGPDSRGLRGFPWGWRYHGIISVWPPATGDLRNLSCGGGSWGTDPTGSR